jgi:cytochrome c5
LLLKQRFLQKELIFIVLKNNLDMKKTLSIIALSVFVWGCSHKMTPASAGAGTGTSGSGTSAAAPATTTSTAAVATLPEDKTGSKTAPGTDSARSASPEMLGQSTYNAKCGRCHGLKVTTDYTADRWVSIMQVMATKARLDDTEKSNVLAYVKANAKR